MTKYVPRSGIYLGAYELTGFTNSLTLEMEKSVHDVTCFPDTYRTRVAGVVDARFSAAGYWSAQELDAVQFDASDNVEDVYSFVGGTNVAGDVAYFMRNVQGTYSWTGEIDGPARWQASGSATQAPIIRGIMLHRDTAAAANGNGTGFQHGAVLSTQSIYGALHVFSVAGTSSPTLTVKIQSDDNSGFTTATDRMTFTAATAIGSEWKSSGPAAITDDYWRANITITGTDPVFGFAVMFGIF